MTCGVNLNLGEPIFYTKVFIQTITCSDLKLVRKCANKMKMLILAIMNNCAHTFKHNHHIHHIRKTFLSDPITSKWCLSDFRVMSRCQNNLEDFYKHVQWFSKSNGKIKSWKKNKLLGKLYLKSWRSSTRDQNPSSRLNGKWIASWCGE